MSEETSHMEFASVSPAELSAQDVTFAVNRLTHQQYLDALDNTVIDKAQNTIVSAVNPSFMSLRPNQFYMTVDEDIKGDFQMSSYVSLVDFYQQTSSTLNFRGVTHDSEWAGQFVTALTASDSPGDVYAGASPSHGDVVFYSENGQEFMYTKSEPPGYWSQIGNDWMLSVIKVTMQAAFSDVSGYIEYLSNYASAYLSGEISGLSDQLDATSSYISGQVHGHITNAGNPHQVTAGQVKAYLCSETSSATQLQQAFAARYLTSETSSAAQLGQEFQKYALSNDVYSKSEMNASFAKYYLQTETSSSTQISGALEGKASFSDVPRKFAPAGVQDVLEWRYEDWSSEGGHVAGLVFDGAGTWTMTYVTQSSETLTADCAGTADADELEFYFPDLGSGNTVKAYKDTVVGKTLEVSPWTVCAFTAEPSTPPLSVAVGPRPSGQDWENSVRDCALVIDCTGTPTPPTVTWPSQFRPKTSGSSDFGCAGGKRNFYSISEYADGLFMVEGWQETQNAAGFTANA